MKNNQDISIEKLTDILETFNDYLRFLESAKEQDSCFYDEVLEERQRLQELIKNIQTSKSLER